MDQYHYTEAKSDKLGEGTYGTVFKAVDRETGRRVAVKKAKLEVSTVEKHRTISFGVEKSGCGIFGADFWYGNQVSVDEGIPCTVIREVALLKVAGQAGNNVVK